MDLLVEVVMDLLVEVVMDLLVEVVMDIQLLRPVRDLHQILQQ
jgi:hypothetical protein